MNYKYFVSDMDYGKEEEEAALGVLKDRWLTMGPRTQAFEQSFSKIMDGAFCALVSSGTAALHLGLHALGCHHGDEVILPSLTFAATANVVEHCGARCVFTDIESLDTPLLSAKSVEENITPETRIIIPVHYAGFSTNMDALKEVVERERSRRIKSGEKRPLYILEDAAHATGARDAKGNPLGSIGDAGCFSFFSNKNIAAGEGGVVVSKSEALIQRIRLLRSHGLTRQTWERHKKGQQQQAFLYDILEPGFNYRPTEITAALASAQLLKMKRILKIRAELYEYVRELLRNESNAIISFPDKERWGGASHHILAILLKDAQTRLPVAEKLAHAGIQTSHHYRPVHTMTYYRKKYPGAKHALPLTEEFAEKEITLPLHSRLSKKDMKIIMKKFIEAIS